MSKPINTDFSISTDTMVPPTPTTQATQPQQKTTWMGRQCAALGNKIDNCYPKIKAAAQDAMVQIGKGCTKVDKFCARLLDPNTPNNIVQQKLDAIGNYIEKTFAPLEKFNKWLDSNGTGKWYKQLAIFLAKLPLRVVRNIVQTLYSLIKGLVYFCVHPVKAAYKFVNTLDRLLTALSKPETWSKLGAGMVGAGIGQALLPGNPLFVISLALGGALMLGGLTVGALDAAMVAKKGSKNQAFLKQLIHQAKQLPEAMATGLCVSLIAGSIQRVVDVKSTKVQVDKSAHRLADNYVARYRLPRYDNLTIKPDGRIFINWNNNNMRWLREANVGYFKQYPVQPIANPIWGMYTAGAVAAR